MTERIQLDPLISLIKRTALANELLLSQVRREDVIEILIAMKFKEKSYKRKDYFSLWEKYYKEEIDLYYKPELRYESSEERDLKADKNYRKTMVEWFYRLIDFFQAEREVVSVAISNLDRVLENLILDRRQFRLASITSLYIAINLLTEKELPLRGMVELCRDEFTIKEFLDMEYTILHSLSWKLHPPTASSFLSYLFLFIEGSESSKQLLFQKASFFVEISTYDYFFAYHKQSDIALASIMSSMKSEPDCIFNELFYSIVLKIFENSPSSSLILHMQDRLQALYKQSKQFVTDMENKELKDLVDNRNEEKFIEKEHQECKEIRNGDMRDSDPLERKNSKTSVIIKDETSRASRVTLSLFSTFNAMLSFGLKRHEF